MWLTVIQNVSLLKLSIAPGSVATLNVTAGTDV